MGGKGSKVADLSSLTQKNQVHPLVQQLEDGLLIYSKSFLSDFWLVYKNKHIVISCFAAHEEHYFDRSERYWVFLVSLFVAFGCTGLMAFLGKQVTCDSMGSNEQMKARFETNNMDWKENCLKAEDVPTSADLGFAFGLLSSVLQLCYDQFAQLVVTCSCVQTCPNCIKVCCEGIGKIAFAVLGFLAICFLVLGIVFNVTMGLDAGVTFLIFVITKLTNFLFITSMTLLVTYYMGRKAQMKPSAAVLATEEGKKKWEEPKKGFCSCCSKPKAACDIWNKHIGADKTFDDLPETAWDYDFEVKVSFCVCCITRTLYTYKGQNPIPDTRNDPEAPASAGPDTKVPEQIKIESVTPRQD